MPSPQKGENIVKLRFGGGVHSRASEADIAENECADGYNFDLDVENREYRPRAPFVLCGTATNGSRINGFATFRDADGNVSLLVQAGDTVYQYDGDSTFTSVGTVSTSARLRGHLDANSPVDGVVLITDLALVEPVMKWDGTTLSDVSFTNETAAGFGTFKAKYCVFDNERAIFANVDAGAATPNLIVGSTRGDYTQISVANRPSSSLGAEDPWFLAQPDNGAINGLAKAYGVLAVSSEVGDTYRLTGADARDFQMTGLFPRSGAQGAESVVTVGADIFFGRQGRIHSLFTTANYGDVESEDISLPISDKIDDVGGWTAAYNARLQRAYWWPEDGGVCYVYHAAFRTPPKPTTEQIADALSGNAPKNAKVSPWVPWTTTHSTDFTPTAVMSVLYPTNGLEYVLFGDASGNIYRMEGEYGSGDGGTADVTASRLSKRFQLEHDGAAFNIQGWISYRKQDAFTVTLTIEASGENIFDESITITIPAATGGSYYGSGSYYGGSDYYGISFSQRVARQKFAVPGKPQEFQVRVAATEDVFWRIEEIGLRFDTAS